MWLNQDSLARSLTYATSTPEVPSTYIHPSPESLKNILLLIRERIAKNISISPLWNKCLSYLVTTTCYIISRDECNTQGVKHALSLIKTFISILIKHSIMSMSFHPKMWFYVFYTMCFKYVKNMMLASKIVEYSR